MIFAKPSARTRISFETGMFQLGELRFIWHLEISVSATGGSKRHRPGDLPLYDLIMARLFAHSDIEELANIQECQ